MEGENFLQTGVSLRRPMKNICTDDQADGGTVDPSPEPYALASGVDFEGLHRFQLDDLQLQSHCFSHHVIFVVHLRCFR